MYYVICILQETCILKFITITSPLKLDFRKFPQSCVSHKKNIYVYYVWLNQIPQSTKQFFFGKDMDDKKDIALSGMKWNESGKGKTYEKA